MRMRNLLFGLAGVAVALAFSGCGGTIDDAEKAEDKGDFKKAAKIYKSLCDKKDDTHVCQKVLDLAEDEKDIAGAKKNLVAIFEKSCFAENNFDACDTALRYTDDEKVKNSFRTKIGDLLYNDCINLNNELSCNEARYAYERAGNKEKIAMVYDHEFKGYAGRCMTYRDENQCSNVIDAIERLPEEYQGAIKEKYLKDVVTTLSNKLSLKCDPSDPKRMCDIDYSLAKVSPEYKEKIEKINLEKAMLVCNNALESKKRDDFNECARVAKYTGDSVKSIVEKVEKLCDEGEIQGCIAIVEIGSRTDSNEISKLGRSKTIELLSKQCVEGKPQACSDAKTWFGGKGFDDADREKYGKLLSDSLINMCKSAPADKHEGFVKFCYLKGEFKDLPNYEEGLIEVYNNRIIEECGKGSKWCSGAKFNDKYDEKLLKELENKRADAASKSCDAGNYDACEQALYILKNSPKDNKGFYIIENRDNRAVEILQKDDTMAKQNCAKGEIKACRHLVDSKSDSWDWHEHKFQSGEKNAIREKLCFELKDGPSCLNAAKKARDQKVELNFLEAGCALNDAESCFNLMTLYRDGSYKISRDEAKAKAYLEKFCKLNTDEQYKQFCE